MGMGSAWWTKGHSLSAFYLLACAVVLMLVTLALEDTLFPQNCTTACSSGPLSGGRVGILSNIGRTRPLVQSPVKEAVMRESLAEKPNSEDLERSKVDVEDADTEIFKGSQGNASLSQVEDDRQSWNESHNPKLPEPKVSIESQDFKEVVSLDGNSSVSEPTSNGGSTSQADLGNGGVKIQVDGAVETTALDVSEFKESGENVTEVSVTASPPPPHISSIWYYAAVYKHPEAKLRLLTAENGAERIRSNITPPDREITIVTQTSADRIQAVEATCMTWGGGMSVAVHVRLKSEIAPVHKLMKQMLARVEEHGRSCRLDIQLVTEDGFETDEEALQALYPVNALRNVAMRMATTKLVFLLDADFQPSPRLHESLTEDEGIYGALLRKATQEKQLFVVAAFEATYQRGIYRNASVPQTMEEVRERWEKGNIYCFHCHQSPTGHMPTKFETFLDPATTNPYAIPYRDGFEPYVIGAAAEIPLYDARFRGYGENKVSHLYSCAAAGMGFQVLPNAYVFELPHPPSQARESYVGRHKDPDQRNRIMGLYHQFRAEVGQKQKEKDPLRYEQFMKSLNR